MATILVLEDEQISLEFIEEVLHRMGFVVFCASGADEAMEYYRQEPDINLIISDIELKGSDLDGDDFVAEVLAQNPQQNVIMISGGYSEHVKRLLKIGNPAFLQKPFTPDSLEDLVRSFIPVEQ